MTAALRRAWLSLLFLAVAASMLVMTFSLNPTARLVPLAVAVPTLAILLVQACLDLFPALSRSVARYLRLELREVASMHARGEAANPRDPGALGPVLAWFAAAPVMILLLGFMPAAPLYTIAFLRWRAAETWTMSLAVGAGVAVVIALLLGFATGRPVFDGLLITWGLSAL